MTIQSAFESIMQVAKNDSEDCSLSAEVRHYAATIFMVMQSQQALIEYQEQEAVEELIEFFSNH
jgi:HEAT repeat protein